MDLRVLPPSWTCAFDRLLGLPGQPARPCFPCPGPDCTESTGGVAAGPHRERLLPGFAAAATQPCNNSKTVSAFLLMVS